MNRRQMLVGGAAVGAAAWVSGGRALAAGPGTNDLDTIVETTAGQVRGRVTGNGVLCFKGIPYGEDTFETRFASPRPPTPWKGVRNAFEWGPRAPQVVGARPQYENATARQKAAAEPGYHLPPDEGPQSEDCLHLNVWTPGVRETVPSWTGHCMAPVPGACAGAGTAVRPEKLRPVMVYIHGGAYSNGTVNAELYDGARLARRGDVVVVTVNHRLNSVWLLVSCAVVARAGL